MKKIPPAYQIPLSRDELVALGELCAIQGQVEHLLVHTLAYVLDIRVETARKILSTSSIHTNAKIWISLMREKCIDREIVGLADQAFALVEGVTQGRNDFVHALFATPLQSSGWLLHHSSGGKHRRAKSNNAVALRTRDMERRRPIGDLTKVRNDAAILSNLLDRIASLYLPA